MLVLGLLLYPELILVLGKSFSCLLRTPLGLSSGILGVAGAKEALLPVLLVLLFMAKDLANALGRGESAGAPFLSSETGTAPFLQKEQLK